MARFFAAALSLFLLAFCALVFIGAALPKQHHISRSAVIHQPPIVIWQAINQHADEPKWRTDVAAEKQIHPGFNSLWEERYKSGQALRYETIQFLEPRLLVRKVIDPEGHFGGNWTYDLQPAPGGTLVTITEDGWVANYAFRFMSRFVIGFNQPLDRYLNDLAGKFGEKAVIR